MPSSIGSFTLTFGLVAIPVRLESAVRSHKIAFRQVHSEDQGRVRYRKICELDEQVLQTPDIGRAYEAGDQLVGISDDDLDRMPLPTAKTIEISGFLDLSSVPGEMFDQPYFLAPSTPAANKPYVLMREALARAGKAAVGKYALRGSGEALGLIRAHGDVLILQRLRWPDEIRAADDAAPSGDVDITAAEAKAADDLIVALGDADMDRFHDEYAEAVRALVEAKVKDVDPPKAKPQPDKTDAGVTDLMAALKAAADKARADRGEDADVHHMEGRTASPKKTAARKKAGAKKTAAKKKAG